MPLTVTWETASTSKGKTYEICRQAPGSDTCWMCCTAMLWALAKDGARPNMDMIEDLMGMAVQQNANRLKAVETFLKATTLGKCKMQQLSDEQLQKAQKFSSPKIPWVLGMQLTMGNFASKHLVLVAGTMVFGNDEYMIVLDPATGLAQVPIGKNYMPTGQVSGTFDGWGLEANLHDDA